MKEPLGPVLQYQGQQQSRPGSWLRQHREQSRARKSQWKNVVILRTRPRRRATRDTAKPRLLARFTTCAKHLMWGWRPLSLTAMSMLLALSVTQAMVVCGLVSSHSLSAFLNTWAMLTPVWLSLSSRVCNTKLFLSHFSLMTSAVMLI